MKCPRTFNLEIIEGEEEKIVGANCLKEECAWWEKPLGVCCIRAQEATLGVILEQLTKLIDKIPYPSAPKH